MCYHYITSHILTGGKALQAVDGEIYYPQGAWWETDYVLKDVLSDLSKWHVNMYSSFEDFMAITSNMSTATASTSTIFVLSELPYAQARVIVEQMQPAVIVHLSDEYGVSPEYLSLAHDTPLMLRQYRHAKYGPVPENLHQMPLGYMTGMLEGTSSIDRNDIKDMHCRSYDWSFIGTMKQDRAQMIETFSGSLSKAYVSHNESAQRTFDVYKESVFVPNGRGWTVLDCFRLYEASLAGAIPVVVGSESEINETFQFDGELPPWIFEHDWDTAAARCVELLKTPATLQALQERNLAWWKDQMLWMRRAITAAIQQK